MSRRGWQNGPARLFAIGAINTPNLIKIQDRFIFLEDFLINLQTTLLFVAAAGPR
jgi:hypothetical protein